MFLGEYCLPFHFCLNYVILLAAIMKLNQQVELFFFFLGGGGGEKLRELVLNGRRFPWQPWHQPLPYGSSQGACSNRGSRGQRGFGPKLAGDAKEPSMLFEKSRGCSCQFVV